MLKREKYLLVMFVIILPFFCVCVDGKHFVLVHGAFHGAWCWYKVAHQLKSEGHNVTTLDMAACGVNTEKIEEVDSVSEYHKPLITFLASLPPQEKVILVGHSLGGLSVSIAMEKYPKKISVAVFISAAVVTQNLTFLAFLQEVLLSLVTYFQPIISTLYPNPCCIIFKHVCFSSSTCKFVFELVKAKLIKIYCTLLHIHINALKHLFICYLF